MHADEGGQRRIPNSFSTNGSPRTDVARRRQSRSSLMTESNRAVGQTPCKGCGPRYESGNFPGQGKGKRRTAKNNAATTFKSLSIIIRSNPGQQQKIQACLRRFWFQTLQGRRGVPVVTFQRHRVCHSHGSTARPSRPTFGFS